MSCNACFFSVMPANINPMKSIIADSILEKYLPVALAKVILLPSRSVTIIPRIIFPIVAWEEELSNRAKYIQDVMILTYPETILPKIALMILKIKPSIMTAANLFQKPAFPFKGTPPEFYIIIHMRLSLFNFLSEKIILCGIRGRFCGNGVREPSPCTIPLTVYTNMI